MNGERAFVKKTAVDDNLMETRAHGTEGFPIGIYLNDFSGFADGYINWHWHEEVQLTYITEGEFACELDGKEIRLENGDIIFINTGALHQIKALKKGKGKLYSFIWRGDFIGGNKNSEIYREYVLPVLNMKLYYAVWNKNSEGCEDMRACLDGAVMLYEGMGELYKLKLHRVFEKIWEMIYNKVHDGHDFDKGMACSENIRDEERIKQAFEYIYAHYNEGIKLDEIARHLFISRSELCRCFKRKMNTTPMEFVNDFRIRQAMVLLKNKEYRIADVAEMVGYCSPSHFGTHFLRNTGYTPREYRERLE